MNIIEKDYTTKNTTKIERYAWKLKDQPGELMLLDKKRLKMHPDYQRQLSTGRALEMASAWSWIACGTIVIGKRGGEYWVIDGQHRVIAAMRRADITTLPCIVFLTHTVEQEAKGFLNVNSVRKPLSSIDKFKALIAAEDPVAIYIRDLFSELGVKPRSSGAASPLELASVGWSLRKAQENRAAFETTVRICVEMCRNVGPIAEHLLDGLYYIHTCSEIAMLKDQKFCERLLKVGSERLVNAARRASAYYARGGAKVWAQGMLDELNKNLHTKFEVKTLVSS